MRKATLFLGLFAACLVTAVVVWRSAVGGDPPARVVSPESGGKALPLTRVILFNTGLGYFQREGDIDGDARIDLSFPISDINDLLKSLVADDNGKPPAISYEGQEPLDRMLRSFAFDLTYNPTFGQLLNQARGEKVEVTTEGAGATPVNLTGSIVGMESGSEEAGKETHSLNLLAADGVRRVPLAKVQRIRFLNPTLEDEFRRALGVLAGTHNSQRRHVRVQLRGEGKRPVKIGYVVESPIWKSSYRLTLDAKAKATLHAYAVVENTTDEDWKDVRMSLIAGRPISYQMDLYQPLFLPRPMVEPRAFASLRPPVHAGNVLDDPEAAGRPRMPGGGFGLAGGQVGLQLGGIQLGGVQLGGGLQIGGFPGTFIGGMADSTLGRFATPGDFYNRYQTGPGGPLGPKTGEITAPRLTYEDLLKRRAEMLKKREQEKQWVRDAGSTLAALGEGAEALAATADTLGEEFSYTLEQKVSLPRQMSALLPVVRAEVKATPVSLYNRQVHPRFPLRALRVKNTTGQHLQQGPISVFDSNAYSGDSQMPDLQPDQEKLISYAMDLGLEVRREAGPSEAKATSLVIDHGIAQLNVRKRSSTIYHLRNRSKQERTLLLEHPITEAWSLLGEEKPAEQTKDLYRFEWQVPVGKSEVRKITEENNQTTQRRVDRFDLRDLESAPASKEVKAALAQMLERQRKLAKVKKEAVEVKDAYKGLVDEQARVRANIDRLTRGTEAHTRFQKKLDAVETQMEKLQDEVIAKVNMEKKEDEAYEQFIRELSAR